MPDLTATETAAAGVLRTALAAGNSALEQGTAAEAERQFSLALKLQPDHPQAKRGLERARNLDELRRLLADAARLEDEGKSGEAAAAYRKALALDRDSAVAAQGLARLASAESNAAFGAAMSAGLEALARRTTVQRRRHLSAPSSARGRLRCRMGWRRSRARRGMPASRRTWRQPSVPRERNAGNRRSSLRRALAIDANLLAAQQGVERAEPRAALEGQLNGFAARPERLFSSEVRAAARNSLVRASPIEPAGPVLRRQIEAVDKLVDSRRGADRRRTHLR